jgi:hypothetical protein
LALIYKALLGDFLRNISLIIITIFLAGCGTGTTLQQNKTANFKLPESLKNENSVITDYKEVFDFGLTKSGKPIIQSQISYTVFVRKASEVNRYQQIYYNSAFESLANVKASAWQQGKKRQSKTTSFQERNVETSSFLSNMMAKVFYLPELHDNSFYSISYTVHYKDINNIDKALLNKDQHILEYNLTIKNRLNSVIELKATGTFLHTEDEVRIPEVAPNSVAKIKYTNLKPLQTLYSNFQFPRKEFYSIHMFPKSDEFIRSYTELGNYFYTLNKENYTIEDSLYTMINKGAEKLSDKEFVNHVFSYVQKEIRYEALLTGIKAYKADAPRTVIENKYGECKSVSFLIVSLLKKRGITAAPVIVNLGHDGYNMQHPKLYMANHLIAYAKVEDEEFWLDATGTYLPTGFVSKEVAENRALIVFDKDNTVERIIKKDKEKEQSIWTLAGDLNEKGSFIGKGTLELTNESAVNFRELYYNSSTMDRLGEIKDGLESYFEASHILNLQISNVGDLNKPLIISFDFEILNVVTTLSDRLLVSLNPVKKLKSIRYSTKKLEGSLWLDGPENFQTKIILNKSKQFSLFKPVQNEKRSSSAYELERVFNETKTSYELSLSEFIKQRKLQGTEVQSKFFDIQRDRRLVFDVIIQLKKRG